MVNKRFSYLSLREEYPRLAFETMFRLSGCAGRDLSPRRRRDVFAGGTGGGEDRGTASDIAASLQGGLSSSVFHRYVTADVIT